MDTRNKIGDFMSETETEYKLCPRCNGKMYLRTPLPRRFLNGIPEEIEPYYYCPKCGYLSSEDSEKSVVHKC